MSVSLKCEVDSNPASTPIWQRGKWQAKKRNGIRARRFAWFLNFSEGHLTYQYQFRFTFRTKQPCLKIKI